MIFLDKTVLPLILAIIACASCKTFDQTPNKSHFLTIDGSPVYDQEFIYVFNKNSYGDTVRTKEEIDEYLNLFINFKLKVREARELGYQNTSDFIREYQTYQEEFSKPYLTENIVSEQLVRQAYERMKEEVNVSHILILADENASPDDTLKAYQQIAELRKRVFSGEDFNKIAREHSQDPSAAANDGNLGYFTALQMVYPFEEQAYRTGIGEVSEVFRTNFGYHILKVHDRRPSQGKIKVSHILVRATAGITARDSLAAFRKINEIYNKLKEGALWFDLCQQFSEDLYTRANGGTLPWFSTGNMPPEFEKAAFSLENIGDITKPVHTAYGWHIIKLEDRKKLEAFDEIRESIQTLVKNDSRSELSRKAYIEKLKKENNFIERKKVVSTLLSDPEQLLNQDTAANTAQLDKQVFKIGQSTYLVRDFLEYVNRKKDSIGKKPVAQFINQTYDDFVDEQVYDYEKAHLAEKFQEYKMLLSEYEEGILLFQLMDDRIWSKALDDSAGIKDFYERNIDRYQWGERLDAVVYNASNESIRQKIRALISNSQNHRLMPLPSGKKILELSEDRPMLSQNQRETLNDLGAILKKNSDWAVILSYNPAGLGRTRIDSVLNFLYGNEVGRDQAIREEDDKAASNQIIVELAVRTRKALEKIFNQQSDLDLQVEEGVFEKGDHQIVDIITWQEGLYEINAANRYYLVEVRKIIPPEAKNLDQIRGIVISDFQNFLEKGWIKELKEKYPVAINEKKRRKIYSRLANN